MTHPCVGAFAKALPSRAVSNDDLSKLMDTSDEWITQRTGIKTRYWVESPVTTSDLAVAAAQKSLADGPPPDAIVACTLSPDYVFPGIGVSIQTKLGLENVPAFDVRNQCAGFLYGLELATALVRAGQYSRVLLVGAEVHSTGVDVSTRGRDIAVLFGDGAGSCLVERDAGNSGPAFEVVETELHSDGSGLQDLWCENPGSASFPRVTKEMIDEATIFPKMNGRKVFENAVRRMTEVSHSLLARNGLKPDQVSLVIAHQANLRINLMVGEQLGLQADRVFNTIDRYGNTTAATIPIGFTDAIAENRIAVGDVVLSPAFGSGYVWGAALLRRVK